MIRLPRQYDVPGEAFAASGNFFSLRVRRVRAAIFEMRMLGLIIISVAQFCIHLAIEPDGRRAYVANSGWNSRQEGCPE